MSSSKEEMQDLSKLVEETSDELTEDHRIKFSELFEQLNLYDGGVDGPIPVETWVGVAQAMSDASGYRVVLQAAILEPAGNDPNIDRIIGHREIVRADPTLFVRIENSD
jgi:hypothetical protein